MSVEQVIEVYDGVVSLSDAPLVIVTALFWIVIGSFLFIHLIKDWKLFSFLGVIFRVSFFVLIFCIVFNLFTTIIKYDFSVNEKVWEENYLKPYINSLSEQEYKVEDFSHLLGDVKGVKSIYLNAKVKPIWIEVFVLDENGHSKQIVLQAIIKKESIDSPYLTYKTIDKDISNKYKADIYYESVLHIPNEYKVLIHSD